jgi:hypothetical protein
MKIKQILIPLLIVFFIILIALTIKKPSITGDAVRENQINKTPDKQWLERNCQCIKADNIKCRNGFTLNNGRCWRGDMMTSPIRECSKYNCTGEIYEVD